MLHDNWIEYFMAWTQICMVVYIFNEMHKTFLQLDLVAYYFWTFKTTNVSYNKLCGFFFTKNKLFLKFQSHDQTYYVWHVETEIHKKYILFYFHVHSKLRYISKSIMNIKMKDWEKKSKNNMFVLWIWKIIWN